MCSGTSAASRAVSSSRPAACLQQAAAKPASAYTELPWTEGPPLETKQQCKCSHPRLCNMINQYHDISWHTLCDRFYLDRLLIKSTILSRALQQSAHKGFHNPIANEMIYMYMLIECIGLVFMEANLNCTASVPEPGRVLHEFALFSRCRFISTF